MRETVTMTLSEFLLARIAEDEAMAQTFAATLDPDAEIQFPLTCRDGNTVTTRYLVPWAPAKALAECGAKRQIVEACLGADHNPYGEQREYGYHDGLASACEHLALPYADHPDYREEWRP